MARRPDHTSGAAVNVTLRLSPEHLAKLDRLCAEKDRSRSKIIMQVLDRVQS